MTTDPGHIAADYLAALTDDELKAFIHDARQPDAAQLTKADLAGMKPEAIEAARVAGRLDGLLGVPREQTELIARAQRRDPVTRADLAELNRLGRYDLVSGYAARLDLITN